MGCIEIDGEPTCCLGHILTKKRYECGGIAAIEMEEKDERA